MDEYDGVVVVDAGAVPHPDGSLAAALVVLLAYAEVEPEDGSVLAVVDGVVAGPLPAARLRKAVTSVLVLTMPTTSQPSADFSVSLTANAAESYEEALTVENSCGMRWRLVPTLVRGRTLTRSALAPVGAAQDGITNACTSVSEGGPS